MNALLAGLFCLFLLNNSWACNLFDGKKIHESSSEFQKLNPSEGLCRLWFQGKQYVDFILTQVGEVAKDGHSKNFEDDDYNFFTFQESNFNSTNINPFIENSPVEDLIKLVNEFQSLIGGKYPQSLEGRSNYYQLAVGIFLNLERAKTIAAGRESELISLQNFLFDHVMDFYLFSPNDPSFAGAILLYARARHFYFPKNYLLLTANEMERIANQHYRSFIPNKKTKETENQPLYKGLLIVATNIYAFCEVGGGPNKFNFHHRGRRLNDWCARRSINLSKELGLPDIELPMRRRLVRYLQDELHSEERINNSIEILNLELEKIAKEDLWGKYWLTFWSYYYRSLTRLPLAAVIIFLTLCVVGILLSPSENSRGLRRFYSGTTNFFKKIFGMEERKLSFFDRLFILILPILTWMLLSPAKLNNLIDGI